MTKNLYVPLVLVVIFLIFSHVCSSASTATSASSDQYKRVIAAGGSITEIMAALGLQKLLVAVDTSSTYPEEVTTLPQIGYFRALGSEGVLSLQPDLLVAARGAGPDKVLQQIENAGVDVVQFEQSVYSLDNWENLVRQIGRFFNRDAAATRLVKKNRLGIQAASTIINPKKAPRVLTVLNTGARGFTVAGKNTVPDMLLGLIGAVNVAGELEGYKPYDTESLAIQKVDLILAPHHTVQAMGGAQGICANVSIKLATAERCRVHIMPALLLLGFGSRLDIAANEIAEALDTLDEKIGI